MMAVPSLTDGGRETRRTTRGAELKTCPKRRRRDGEGAGHHVCPRLFVVATSSSPGGQLLCAPTARRPAVARSARVRSAAKMAMVDEEKIFKAAQAEFFANVRAGNVEAVSAAIQRKPLKNFRGESFGWLTMTTDGIEGQTAFLLAAEAGSAAMLELLAARGADVTVADHAGETGLHAAAAKNHTAAVTALLGLGVALDAKNHDGETALYVATKRAKLDAMRLLLQARADPEVAKRTGETALGRAARENKPDLVALLLAAGASVHALDRHEHSPLHHLMQSFI